MLQKTPFVIVLLSLAMGALPAHNADATPSAEPGCCPAFDCSESSPEAPNGADCWHEDHPVPLAPLLHSSIKSNQAAAIVWGVTGLPVRNVRRDGNIYRVTVQTSSGAYLMYCVDVYSGEVWQC